MKEALTFPDTGALALPAQDGDRLSLLSSVAWQAVFRLVLAFDSCSRRLKGGDAARDESLGG